MSKTLQGIYRNGRVELVGLPGNLREGPVLITFLEPGEVDLPAKGMDEEHAADLRARLSRFDEGWSGPEMQVYDDYDASRASMGPSQ